MSELDKTPVITYDVDEDHGTVSIFYNLKLVVEWCYEDDDDIQSLLGDFTKIFNLGIVCGKENNEVDMSKEKCFYCGNYESLAAIAKATGSRPDVAYLKISRLEKENEDLRNRLNKSLKI